MITILERVIKDNFYIKVDMNDALDKNTLKILTQFEIESIVLTESMLSSTTHMNMKFLDYNGVLLTNVPLLPSNSFDITYGVDQKNAKSTSFRYSTSNVVPMSGTSNEAFLITSDMIIPKWNDMFVKTFSRSWKNMRYSDVVADMVVPFEFDEIEIEPTKNIQTVIQPNCNNASFLKWLSRNSMNELGVGGYVYYITLDNEFHYKTIEDIIVNSDPIKIEHHSFSKTGVGFNNIKFSNEYFTLNSSGGLGTKHTHFDYNTKKFVEGDSTIEDVLQHQLTDVTIHNSDDIDTTYNLYGGRDTNTQEVVHNKLTAVLNSSIKAEVEMLGRTDVTVGDKLDLIVPVSKTTGTYTNSVINELYSGLWIVWKVSHIFDIKSKKYITKAFVFRDGINSIDSDEFVTTAYGKNIG